MKLIKFLLLFILLSSFQCSKDEVEKNDCDCKTVYYKLPVGSSQFEWYNTVYDENNELECKDAMESPQHTGQDNIFYQIECE